MRLYRDAKLNLIVDTAAGTFVRAVPDAQDLVSGIERGVAAEEATTSAVATWGLPDFVFTPKLRRVSSGTRELGDALILLDNRAAVVQVKSREATSRALDREAAWIDKHAAKGHRQALGTLRSLRRESAIMRNLRGRDVIVDPGQFEWIFIIVIDHEDPPEVVPRTLAGPTPAVVLWRRDWEFLYDQLRSTTAVIDYLFRTAGDDLAIGGHPARYYELALADEASVGEPVDLPAAMLRGGAGSVSVPLLPLKPVDLVEDGPQLLVRIMLEDIAESEFADAAEDVRIRVLAELDQFHVAGREELGAVLETWLDEVAVVDPPGILWRFRRFLYLPPRVSYVFGAATYHSASIQEGFNQFVMLRHTEHGTSIGALDEVTTIGVLLTPRHDGLREWDTTMCRVTGDLGLSDDYLAELAQAWSTETPGDRT